MNVNQRQPRLIVTNNTCTQLMQSTQTSKYTYCRNTVMAITLLVNASLMFLLEQTRLCFYLKKLSL